MPSSLPILILIGGLTLLTLVAAQILIGTRKIKFKGATHMKVHKALAWALLGLAVLHGLGGAVVLGIIPLP